MTVSLERDAAKTTGLTLLALFAFAANSVLCRLALEGPSVDPVSFTSIRVLAAAVTLIPLAWAARSGKSRWIDRGGSWTSAAVLFLYALPFSLAYIDLDAGVGALILFASVQTTMLGAGMLAGERPGIAEWLGLFAAFAGLVYLLAPGASAPSLSSAVLMIIAGAAWGLYSLRGRSERNPLAGTAGNFAMAVPFALIVSAIGWPYVNISPYGAALAVASGAMASGLGYVVWYAALGGLTATTAAIVQLAVPVIAGFGGVVLMQEEVSLRLLVASGLILGGVALAIVGRAPANPQET